MKLAGFDASGVVGPILDNAGLVNQRVLEPAVKREKTRIVFGDDVLNVIGRLFSYGEVFRRLRHKLDGLLRSKEYAQQGRQNCVDRVPHVLRDYLTSACPLIPKRLRVVILRGLSPER